MAIGYIMQITEPCATLWPPITWPPNPWKVSGKYWVPPCNKWAKHHQDLHPSADQKNLALFYCFKSDLKTKWIKNQKKKPFSEYDGEYVQLTTKLIGSSAYFPLNSIVAPTPKPYYYAIRINNFIKPMLVSHLQL